MKQPLEQAPRIRRGAKFWILAGLFSLFIALVGTGAMLKITAPNEFCVTCHEMDFYMDTYAHSSHKDVAGCNDCHTDQSNLAAKVLSKGSAGLRHGVVKVMGAPEHIQLSKRFSYDTVQQNCLRCHSDLIHDTSQNGGDYCFQCHRYTPHGKIY